MKGYQVDVLVIPILIIHFQTSLYEAGDEGVDVLHQIPNEDGIDFGGSLPCVTESLHVGFPSASPQLGNELTLEAGVLPLKDLHILLDFILELHYSFVNLFFYISIRVDHLILSSLECLHPLMDRLIRVVDDLFKVFSPLGQHPQDGRTLGNRVLLIDVLLAEPLDMAGDLLANRKGLPLPQHLYAI